MAGKASASSSENALWIGNFRNALKWLLLLFSIVSSTYLVALKGEWVWFSWHPTSMIFAFIFLAGFSILTKKAGGYVNTKIHGITMAVATILGCFGWYVIYTNKELLGKPHLVTLHAKIGVVVLVAYLLIACFSFPSLNPDWGVLKTNKIIRLYHKYLYPHGNIGFAINGWQDVPPSWLGCAAFMGSYPWRLELNINSCLHFRWYSLGYLHSCSNN